MRVREEDLLSGYDGRLTPFLFDGEMSCWAVSKSADELSSHRYENKATRCVGLRLT